MNSFVFFSIALRPVRKACYKLKPQSNSPAASCSSRRAPQKASASEPPRGKEGEERLPLKNMAGQASSIFQRSFSEPELRRLGSYRFQRWPPVCLRMRVRGWEVPCPKETTGLNLALLVWEPSGRLSSFNVG